jgi:hypothetical protein
MKTLILAVSLLFVSLDARAQQINLSSLDAEPNRVHVTTGAEHAFVAGAGYSRILPFLDRQIVLGADATLPWAGIDVSDYRLRASALVPIVGTQRWKLAASLAPIVRGTHNKISTLTDVGLDVGMVGGFYTRRIFIAGELGFDAALSTHVTHSDEYRMNVHPDAVDGWYASPGGNLRAGVQAGVAFARYDVMLRIGQVRDVDGNAPLLPFYGTITAGSRF